MQVKESLQEKEGIPSDMIRLICGGKALYSLFRADEKQLKEYKIDPGNVIHMVLFLKG